MPWVDYVRSLRTLYVIGGVIAVLGVIEARQQTTHHHLRPPRLLWKQLERQLELGVVLREEEVAFHPRGQIDPKPHGSESYRCDGQ